MDRTNILLTSNYELWNTIQYNTYIALVLTDIRFLIRLALLTNNDCVTIGTLYN